MFRMPIRVTFRLITVTFTRLNRFHVIFSIQIVSIY